MLLPFQLSVVRGNINRGFDVLVSGGSEVLGTPNDSNGFVSRLKFD
jgi:hypothetical protein